ncbi:hypothetical protein ACWOAQ_08555 [Helcococcus kunzii]
MIKAISIINKKNFYSGYNTFIYFLQKIPLLGKLIPNKTFNITGFDPFINIISFVFNSLYKVITKTIFYGFIIFIIMTNNFHDILIKQIGMDTFTKADIFLYLLVCVTLIGTMIYQVYFYENNLETYLYVKQMKLNPRDFYLGAFFYNVIIFFVSFVPVNYFILKFLGFEFSIWQVLSFIVFAYSFRFLIAWIFLELKILDEKKRDIMSYINWGIMITLVLAMILYVILTKHIINFSFLFDLKFLAIGAMIFAISIYFLLKNQSIEDVSYASLNLAKLKSIDVENINQMMYKIDGDKLEKGEVDFSNYSGIEYINKIFFYRTSHLLKWKKIRGILIRASIFIGLIVLSFIFKEEINGQDIQFLDKYMHIVLFCACYFLFSGDFFIRYCFLNMDLSLMKNNFYRDEKLLLKSIKIRVIELIKYYMIPFILYLVMTLIVSINLEMGLFNIIRNIVFVIMGLIFFTFHYLFAYYIIQPFTVGMEVKNPLYTMLTYIIYMAGYFSIMSGIDTNILTIAFAVFSIVYIVLGFIGVIKLAPKRFKIR